MSAILILGFTVRPDLQVKGTRLIFNSHQRVAQMRGSRTSLRDLGPHLYLQLAV